MLSDFVGASFEENYGLFPINMIYGTAVSDPQDGGCRMLG